MNDFSYERPTTVEAAVAAVKKANDDGEGKFLGGGQSFIPMLKLGLAQPSAVIKLDQIEALRGIEASESELDVGAATTHAEVAASAIVQAEIPALADLAGHIGDPAVRNRGTLGGSVAHNDPAADYPAALVALDAVVVTDRREMAAADFFSGMFATALDEDELVTRVRFQLPEKAAYAKFAHPASKYAVVGVFVAKRRDGSVRVAVTGAGTNVFRVEAMEQALASNFAAGALDGVAVAHDDFVSDTHASADYRGHLVGVMAKRAVAACA